MRHLYIVIDQDDDRELVYKPTEYTPLHDWISEQHPVPQWTFEHEDYRVTVYPIALFHMPVGEELEEIERRILDALGIN